MSMIDHLSDTLEVRSYLNRVGAGNALADHVLESLEKFLGRLINGPFRLRNAQETAHHGQDIREILAAVSGTEPAAIELSTQSLQELVKADPVGQMLIYSVAETGSVAQVIDTTELHRTRRDQLPPVRIKYQGETRNIGLERRLRTLLNSNGLKQVLRASQYGVAFTKIFEKSIVSYYTVLFAHAMAGDVALVQKLLPLAKMFRANMPVGRYPKEAGQHAERWLVFTE